MTTDAALPWEDNHQWASFRATHAQATSTFEHGLYEETGVDSNELEYLRWRHWIVSFSVRYAIMSVAQSEGLAQFVECGVGDGLTALFALREAEDHAHTCSEFDFEMHCYDAWQDMQADHLLDSEMTHVGQYANASLQRTQQNLRDFASKVTYHRGLLPEALTIPPDAPDKIIYLSIDLNAAKPTQGVLDFFYPRLLPGGVVLFDDYGHPTYEDTKECVDAFFADKHGVVLKLPTGQAIYFNGPPR